MDNCLPDWNTEIGVEFPLPIQRKPLGLENDLVELLWQNGEVVLHSQNNRKQSKQQVHKHDQSTTNPNNLIQDDETISWIDCPIDESFEKEFYANFSSSELPSFNPVETTNKLEKRLDFAPLPLPPPPRFDTFDTSHDQNQISIGFGKTDDLHSPVKKQAINRKKQVPVTECSVRTIGTSHCASNQVANETDMSWASKVSVPCESTEKETVGQAITSCSGGSGSSFWNQSNDHTNGHKRKSRDVEESECRSDATELESAAGNKTSQKSGTTRRSRVAEVHNLSERRRRDRINEKMRALQELIPHSNKSDKASMLDEAIEYMKSLQLQLQLMWMGSGMAPMMLPGMQHYMSRFGMGIGPPMLPAIQNLMRLSRLPLVDQAINIAPRTNQAPVGHSPVISPVNYQNQMQNPGLPGEYANYMGFHSIPNANSQPVNMFNFGFHSAQQNNNGNGSIG